MPKEGKQCGEKKGTERKCHITNNTHSPVVDKYRAGANGRKNDKRVVPDRGQQSSKQGNADAARKAHPAQRCLPILLAQDSNQPEQRHRQPRVLPEGNKIESERSEGQQETNSGERGKPFQARTALY